MTNFALAADLKFASGWFDDFLNGDAISNLGQSQAFVGVDVKYALEINKYKQHKSETHITVTSTIETKKTHQLVRQCKKRRHSSHSDCL